MRVGGAGRRAGAGSVRGVGAMAGVHAGRWRVTGALSVEMFAMMFAKMFAKTLLFGENRHVRFRIRLKFALFPFNSKFKNRQISKIEPKAIYLVTIFLLVFVFF